MGCPGGDERSCGDDLNRSAQVGDGRGGRECVGACTEAAVWPPTLLSQETVGDPQVLTMLREVLIRASSTKLLRGTKRRNQSS